MEDSPHKNLSNPEGLIELIHEQTNKDISGKINILVAASSPQELRHLDHIVSTYSCFRDCKIDRLIAFEDLPKNRLRSNAASPSRKHKPSTQCLLKRITLSVIRSLFIPLKYTYQTIGVLLSYKCNIILIGSDVNPRSISTYLTHFGSMFGMLILVSPFCLSNHEEHIYTARKTGICKTINSHIKSQFLRLLWGPWIYLFGPNSQFIIFYKFFISGRLIEILGIFHGNPWIPCGGKSHLILVESRFEYDYYVQNGVNSSKLKLLTPNINYFQSGDRLISHEKNTKLDAPYLINNKPRLLWSPLPDFLESEFFSDYKEYLFWHLKTFSELSCSLLISLHPRASKKAIISCLNQLSSGSVKNFSFSDCSLIGSISQSDLFICTNSTAIKYSLMERKPVINFDFALQGYSEYYQIKPVYNINTPPEFTDFLKCLMMDPGNTLQTMLDGFSNFPDNYFGSKH